MSLPNYGQQPRVISTYSRSMTQILIDICDNVDFRKPYFNNKVGMRNRSLGSAQALVVALALSDDAFVEKLRKLMDSNGKGFTLSMSYTDKFYI